MNIEKLKRSVLPNFFIVGAPKAGTTSLYHYLSQHPQIFMSAVKEPHFFSQANPDPRYSFLNQTITDTDEYINLFVGASDFEQIGESSTSYLWDQFAPGRIFSVKPDAKIIAILREPVDRAYSHYLMDVREGIQRKNFLNALIDDYESTKKGWDVSRLYIELGFYGEQIKRYIDTFGQDNVLVLFYDDLVYKPEQFLKQVLTFLGVDYKNSVISGLDKHNNFALPRNNITRFIIGNRFFRLFGQKVLSRHVRKFVRHNVLLSSSSKPIMSKEARKFLLEIYHDDIVELKNVLNSDLPWYNNVSDAILEHRFSDNASVEL